MTGSSLVLSLNPLQVSDAGQYTCNVSVSSPFLTGPQSATDTFTINVQSKFLSNIIVFVPSLEGLKGVLMEIIWTVPLWVGGGLGILQLVCIGFI